MFFPQVDNIVLCAPLESHNVNIDYIVSEPS